MHTCEDVGIGRSTETQYETGAGAKMWNTAVLAGWDGHSSSVFTF